MSGDYLKFKLVLNYHSSYSWVPVILQVLGHLKVQDNGHLTVV